MEVLEILEKLSVLAACWAIISGIDAWRREFIGKRQIELAEEVLSRLFEVKDAVAFIRNPFSSQSEGESRQKELGESPEVTKILNRANIVYERYAKKEAAFNSFRSLKYRFMAAFGPQHEELFWGVEKQLRRVFLAAQMLGSHYWQRQGRVEMERAEFETHLKEMWEHEQVFWDHGKEDDPIRSEFTKLQSSFEKVVAPCFTEAMQSYSLLTKRFWISKFGRVGSG